MDVASLSKRVATESEGPWILLTEDAYAFAVGLFALWHAGRHAISPPNRQPGALHTVHSGAVGILSDRSDWFPGMQCLHPLGDFEIADPDLLSPLDSNALALELFTSGTTGGQKPVAKQIRHLEDEVVGLHAIWGERLADVTFFLSASHQHVYGLLFGVLWPLHAGRPFHRHHPLLPGELIPRLRDAGSFVLASVPTHLRRFARHAHASSLRDRCRIVFSSGGPLPTETAWDVSECLGEPPIEVLGSTETGGIAWRTQPPDAPDALWTPFEAVDISSEGEESLLRVRSPFVSVDSGSAGFATGDRADVRLDGRFELRGRLDRVVKIAEKRLDLAEMASELRALDEVEATALTTIDRDGERRVAAAIVPSQKGWASITRRGQREFIRALRDTLADSWDPVLRPRHWRILSALPADAQGKTTLDALHELFVHPEAERPSDRARVLEECRGDGLLERSCQVPLELDCFAGHFPDQPMVPAVLQLDWAMELASDLLDAPMDVAEVEILKFLAPLGPGDTFRMQVRLRGSTHVEFTLSSDEADYARGRVRIRTPRRDRS